MVVWFSLEYNENNMVHWLVHQFWQSVNENMSTFQISEYSHWFYCAFWEILRNLHFWLEISNSQCLRDVGVFLSGPVQMDHICEGSTEPLHALFLSLFLPPSEKNRKRCGIKIPMIFLITSNEIVKAAWRRTKQTHKWLYPCEKKFCALQRRISAHAHT